MYSHLLICLMLLATSAVSYAQDKAKSSDVAPTVGTNENVPETTGSKLGSENEKDKKFRNFYQVLEETMADFEYDVKNGQVTGLKNLAIRNIGTSENVPPSFKQHLELVSSEKIVRNSRTRMIQCMPCKAKSATLSGENVVISSTDSNSAQLARIAKMSGIENFMDIAFSYQPSGMLLSYNIVDAENGTIIWSKSYNSETSRAAAFRRGVDYNQISNPNKDQIEYAPSVVYRPTIYYFYQSNVGTYTSVIGLGFRMMERYDNRKKEVGFEANYMLDVATLTGANAAEAPTTVNLYSGLNLTLLFVHAWNLWGEIENYHKVRNSIFVAAGGTYAAGFLGAIVRVGHEWRMGKHWAVPISLGYRPASSAFLNGTNAGSVSGIEFGLGVSALF